MDRAKSVMPPAGLLLWLLACSAFLSGSPNELVISHRARSLQPGEVVLLTVESPSRLVRLEARVFERTYLLYPVERGRKWEGLVGIDLEVGAGQYSILLLGRSEEGEIRGDYPLAVSAKQFPTRNLTVEPKYVTPPENQLRRIEEESKLVSSIFAKVTPDRFWSGSFVRPVPGPASSNFGSRSVFNGQPRSPHTGTDFTAPEGTPVKAPAAGEVVLAKDLYFAGNTVIVDHGLGFYSYFAHLSTIDVGVGDMVEPGRQIGRVGATGRVTGPHLHWTVRLAQSRVSPLSVLDILGE